MPVIRAETSIPANGSVKNIIADSIYEILPWNASVNVGNNAAATGILLTINSGSDTVLEESPSNVSADFPVIPDDMDVQDVAAQGEKLVITARNTTGAPILLRTLVQLTPL